MKTEKIHRKYPSNGWEYKAISTMFDGREVIYHKVNDNGEHREGVEVYSGGNYIVGSKEKSYSRAYKINRIPRKYESVVNELKFIHEGTKWSNENHINEN